MVAEHHLQRMAARRERELDLRLAAAEMPMLLVVRERQARGSVGSGASTSK